MKRYFNIERDKPFGILDRLSRLFNFDIRLQFGIESGADFCAGLVLFGHGFVLGFTRGMPHIVGGFYVSIHALTEQVTLTAGFESDWYHDYLNDPIGLAIAANELSGGTEDFGIRNACSEGCCSHEDVAECHDEPANTTAGDLSSVRVVAPKLCAVARHRDIGCDVDCAGRK